jgi:uncharacterized protein (DUF488 family)
LLRLVMNNQRSPIVYTVGHSNGSFESFARLLELHAVQVVADVRSYPFSKYCKHFDTDNVRASLKNAGYLYVFMGSELGGKPKGDQFYDDEGHVLYERIAATPAFERGLERLVNGIPSYTIALMCGEEDPTHCHRRLLVGRVLQERDVQVAHIRGDGSVQTDSQLEVIQTKGKAAPANVEQLNLFGGPLPESVAEPAVWKSMSSVARPKF